MFRCVISHLNWIDIELRYHYKIELSCKTIVKLISIHVLGM